MKQLLCIALLFLAIPKAHAQYITGHISINLNDTGWHDSTTCQNNWRFTYLVNIDSSWAGETLYLIDTAGHYIFDSSVNTTGASPWTFSLLAYTASGNDYYPGVGYATLTAPTQKVICGADTLRYITATDSFFELHACNWGTVSGTIYIDNNGDCTFDSGDVGLNSVPVSVADTLSTGGILGWAYGSPAYSGSYSQGMQQSWMTSYSIFIPAYYAFIFPASPCFSTTYTFDSLPQTNVNFPLECTSNVDVECYALSPAHVRPLAPFYLQPFVNNSGCDSMSGQMTLVLDNRVTYDSSLSTFPPDTVRGDTMIWNYYNLTNLSGGAYWNSFSSQISLTADSSVSVGDTLCFRIYTNIPPADIDPANNDYTVCLPVVYSYDPNEKEVSPAGTGPEGYINSSQDTLSYNIHFQNTGSDYAYNITVMDTLDANINPASLRVIGASANMTPQWLAHNVVAFNFNDIYLPDSSMDQAGSQGEVRFSVVLDPGLAPGTRIQNTGYVYFDSNPPVITNTTLNTIARTTAVNTVPAVLPVKVYPNPASDNITVENLGGGDLTILDMDGAVLLRQHIATNKVQIDINALPPGVYMLRAVSDSNTITTKLIKY